MKNNFSNLNDRLNTLSIFRSLLDTPLFKSLRSLLQGISKEPFEIQLSLYGEFVSEVYRLSGNLSESVKKLTLDDENFYVINKSKNTLINPSIEECLNNELNLLQEVSNITSSSIKAQIDFEGFLPDWDTSSIDLKSDYKSMIKQLPFTGYGVFSKYNAFSIRNGKLAPITYSDKQNLNSLYGYQRERNLVFENTKALVNGKTASNVLLYGDAGTGKSSTIKAVANHFFESGLRLVEFNKNQLDSILPIMEELSNNPLKFILYIDDLSFSQNDDTFCSLKGILEGSVSSYAGNIAIYATSNRRHLLKESMEDRVGNQLHINDSLQETMSLAARFGLTITFSKPEKDLYLEIVKSLADEYNVTLPDDQLYRKAEAFAIRSSGRSPRTAKQFIRLLNIGL